MNRPSTLTTTVSLTARMPGPLLPVGVLAAAAASTGSMFTTATLAAAALVGISISAPAASAGVGRFGARNILLISAIVHVLMLVLMVTSIDRLTRGDTLISNATIYVLLLSSTLIAGLSTPAVATFSRAGSWNQSREVSVRPALRTESRLDDAALVTAPLLLGLLSFSFGPTVGLLASAVITAVAVPLYAMEQTHPREVPGESARLSLPGAEHAQQQLLEHRGLALDHPAAESSQRDVQEWGEVDVARDEHSPGWARGILAAIGLAAALGLVLGGLWITVLDAAQALARPSLFALALGLGAAAAVCSARWRPSRFTDPLTLRRRRLQAALMLVLSLLLVPLAAGLPAGGMALLLVSFAAVLLCAVLGRLVLGLYAGLALGVPAHRVPTAITAVAGGVLLGVTLGLTVAGIAADEIGPGWSAAVVLAGSLLAAVVVLSGRLWGGSPESRAVDPALTRRDQ